MLELAGPFASSALVMTLRTALAMTAAARLTLWPAALLLGFA
jgi:hypothetical protein